jgi:hypothetical protein
MTPMTGPDQLWQGRQLARPLRLAAPLSLLLMCDLLLLLLLLLASLKCCCLFCYCTWWLRC